MSQCIPPGNTVPYNSAPYASPHLPPVVVTSYLDAQPYPAPSYKASAYNPSYPSYAPSVANYHQSPSYSVASSISINKPYPYADSSYVASSYPETPYAAPYFPPESPYVPPVASYAPPATPYGHPAAPYASPVASYVPPVPSYLQPVAT